MERTQKFIEFDRKQREKLLELLHESEPKTQKERDIWNLKYMRYSIPYGSWEFRSGFIKTLDRAIKMLEEQDD